MKRQWKTVLAFAFCLVLIASLFTACDMTVTVVWNPNYDGATPTTKTVQFGSTVTPPTITRKGYELEGWYLDADCTKKAVDDDFYVVHDVTFYANWTKLEPTLQSISATYNGSDLEIGWTLDPTDVTVTAYYSDSSNKQVSNFTLSTLDSSTAGTKTVTVSYTENSVTKTDEISVKVVEPKREKVLTGIVAVYTGGNVRIGAQPDKQRLTVTAYYDNDTHRVVTNYQASTIDTSTEGEKDWTITYTENGVTKDTTVKITVAEISVADMSIHFLMLGNQYTGDSVYIKAGDVDILIDAGSRTSSAGTIADYVDQYCTDGILEYVIVTHAHQDHIAGFVGTSSVKGIFERYECQTIITFAQTNATTQIYKDFTTALENERSNGANVYTAQDCIDNSNEIPNVFEIADGITMEILDQRYYRDKTDNENNYSVCALFTHGDNHYLFTGDLEGDGETSLVALNPNLPEVELYKGGHHGSYTAGNTVLLEKIKPKNICICCCAGNVEYLTGATYDKQNLAHSFPAQEFIDRIAPYTDNVYVTTHGFIKDNGTKWVNDGFEPMNGNIVFSCIDGTITIHGSNNDTKLKDTEWFKEYRTCPDAWKDQE